jgi:predicted secreted hydrolase
MGRWWAAAVLVGCAHVPLRSPADGPPISFPADQAPHPWAQTEWWHLHASLVDSASGESVDVFAGFVVQRTQRDRVAGVPVGWLVGPLHVAYVRIQGDRTHIADRVGFPDRLSARFVGDGLDLRHGDWRLAWEQGAWVLSVHAGTDRMDLRFLPTAPAVLPGDHGLVALEPGGGLHHWAQHEDLEVSGRWRRGRETRRVEGAGFCKHQWGYIYSERYEGFEWLTVDLPATANNTERSLSILWMLDDAQRGAPGSQAWFADREGVIESLDPGSLHITPVKRWHSRRSGAWWPVAWQVEGPGIDLRIEAEDPAQELWVFPIPMHLGAARAVGMVQGQAVDLPAFAEQAGERIPPFRWLVHSGP